MRGKFVFGMKTCVWLWLILTVWMFNVPQAVEGAGIYKWKDDTGRVHFTDSPQKIPEKYRQRAKVKKMPFRAPPASAVKPMSSGGEDASDPSDPKNASEPGEAGMARSEDEAKMMQEAISFLNQDLERYKKYEDFVPQRRSAILLRNEIVGALPAKEALAKKLEASQSPSLQEAKSFLKASIAMDLEVKKQEYPKRLVFIGERIRINGEKAQKSNLIEKLKSELQAAPNTSQGNSPPISANKDAGTGATPTPPEGSQSEGGY